MTFDQQRIDRFLRARARVRPDAPLTLDVQPLGGGLASDMVAVVRGRSRGGTDVCEPFVVKHLAPHESREEDIYRGLSAWDRSPGPAFLGSERLGDGRTCLYLEYIVTGDEWPWRDDAAAARVVRQLALLHSSGMAPGCAPPWDYEGFLSESARETLDVLASVAARTGARWARAGLRATRQLVERLPEARAALVGQDEVFIHGDVHPGNVRIASRATGSDVVLIDWARARRGAGLEDVSSWLQSLGYWEPAVRRRHDTLLREYVRARGWAQDLSAGLRASYWLAGACNSLAGALRFHLLREDEAAARDWLRIIRRGVESGRTLLSR